MTIARDLDTPDLSRCAVISEFKGDAIQFHATAVVLLDGPWALDASREHVAGSKMGRWFDWCKRLNSRDGNRGQDDYTPKANKEHHDAYEQRGVLPRNLVTLRT